MDTSRSFVKIYGVTPQQAEDFEFDYDTGSSDLLTELVPNLDNWAGIGWMELEEYEYNIHGQTAHLILDTKWESPVEWLRHMSAGSHYFQNKLILMNTIQKDETCVTSVAVMDGEILQHKQIWNKDSDEVAKYYNDNETDYDLDDLDNQIWDSIGKFVKVCEQFYLDNKGDKEND